MGKKLCPHILLEGTRLTHKTEIAFALNEHPRITGPRKYRYHSPIVSAEWCALTNTPWGRGLINFEPAEREAALETYRTWLRLFELQRYYSWIVDRFHISTRACQLTQFQRELDLSWVDDRLASLNFSLIFCVRSPDTFVAARRDRLRVSGNPGQYDNLSRFVAEQELMRRLVGESSLKTLEIDVSDGALPRICNEIADWLEATGGLYQN